MEIPENFCRRCRLGQYKVHSTGWGTCFSALQPVKSSDKLKRPPWTSSKGISHSYSSIRLGTGCVRSQATSSLSVRMGASAISPPCPT